MANNEMTVFFEDELEHLEYYNDDGDLWCDKCGLVMKGRGKKRGVLG